MNQTPLPIIVLSGIAGAIVVAVGFGLLRADRPGDAEAEQSPTEVASDEAQRTKLEYMIDRDPLMTRILPSDKQFDRDFRLQAKGAGLAAEGLDLPKPGSLAIVSPHTKGVLKQDIVSAQRVRGDEQIGALARNDTVVAKVRAGDEDSSARYDGFFEGLDLEYRYDGEDVEEFFHIDAALKDSLVAAGDDLVVTSMIPDMYKANGDLLMDRDSMIPLEAAPVPGEAPPGPHDMAKKTHVTTTNAIEVNHQGHRFVLPQAIALDGNGAKHVLARTWRWTEDGVQVDVRLPAAWLAEAEGEVVVDPGVIVAGRGVRVHTWNEQSVIRDSSGRIHVGMMVNYTGRWYAGSSRSDGPGGANWDAPILMQPNWLTNENTQYAPSLVIDSTDRLHAIWGDHGHVPDYPAQKGNYTSWGHRVRYAYCDAGCPPGSVYQPTDSLAQLITPTDNTHQAYSHIAVDANDTVHMSWFSWGNVTRSTQYWQRTSGGTWFQATEPDPSYPPYYHTNIVIDSGNVPYLVISNYHGSRDIEVYSYNQGADTWNTLATAQLLQPRNNSSMHHHHLASTIDSSNRIHVGVQVYNFSPVDKWSVAYGRYDIGSDTWNDVHHINELPDASTYYEEFPGITVDANDTAWMAFRRVQTPSPAYVWLTDKHIGEATRRAPWVLFGAGEPHTAPQIRPRLHYPANGVSNGAFTNNEIDIVFSLQDSNLVWTNPHGPIYAPFLAAPPNHSLFNGTANLAWNRVDIDSEDPNDPDRISYILSIATSPRFTVATCVTCDLTVPGNSNQYQFVNGGADACFYWRVRATSPSLGSGPWSRIHELCDDGTAPAAFTLTAPAQGVDPQSQTPRFTWSPAIDN